MRLTTNFPHLLARPKEGVPIRYLEPSVCLTSVERVPSSLNVGCVTLKSLIGDVSFSYGPDVANLADILYNIPLTILFPRTLNSPI